LLIFAAILPPSDKATPTSTPIIEPIIIQTTEIVLSPTSYTLPTLTQPATSPPLETLSATATVIFVMPTSPPSGSGPGICPCAADTLNCPDFPTDPDAQACMDYCISIGAGDIHNLDGNANGLACDGTP
jgi:hypothetical protein